MAAPVLHRPLTPSVSQPAVTASMLGLAYLAVLAWAMHTRPYGYWGAIALAPVLVAIAAPVIVHVTRDDPGIIRTLAFAGLGAKLAGAFVRYHVIVGAYGALGDAQRYHDAGVDIASRHHGWLGPIEALPTTQGTRFIDELTGFVYTIIGPSRMGGFVVFSFLGYWGLFCFQRAVRTAAPSLDQVRYAKLVFLWPSLLFWPSSIGKEAWMLFALGIAALGAARLLDGRLGGATWFVAGAGAAFMVRPHMAVLLVAALAVALVVPGGRASPRSSPVLRIVLVVAVLAGLAFALGRTASFFGVSGDATSSVDQILAITEQRTGQGGSEIESVRPNSPLDYPAAVVTVLVRPFPFEAGSTTTLIAAGEGTLFAALAIASRHRIRSALRGEARTRYVAFALVYAALFVFAFSSFSNLGLLARQRTQVMPLVFVVLAGQRLAAEHRSSSTRHRTAA